MYIRFTLVRISINLNSSQLNMFREIILPIFRSTRLCVTPQAVTHSLVLLNHTVPVRERGRIRVNVLFFYLLTVIQNCNISTPSVAKFELTFFFNIQCYLVNNAVQTFCFGALVRLFYLQFKEQHATASFVLCVQSHCVCVCLYIQSHRKRWTGFETAIT